MEKSALAGLIVFFIGVIVILAIFPSITGNQSIMTQTANSYVNTTFTMNDINIPKVLSSCEQGIVSMVMTNKTNGTIVPSSEYSTSQVVSSSTGVLSAAIQPTGVLYANDTVNVSCTYKPFGYIEDSGGRVVAGLIVLFAALALMVFGIYKWAEMNGWISWFT